MDRFCLAVGKRCIMWDDESNGFYLVSAMLVCHKAKQSQIGVGLTTVLLWVVPCLLSPKAH
jgi:hypothetical protein